MVICLERGADLHMAQLMPLPLTVSCSSKIHIGFTFLVLAYPGCPGKEAVKWLLLLLLLLQWMLFSSDGCRECVKHGGMGLSTFCVQVGTESRLQCSAEARLCR